LAYLIASIDIHYIEKTLIILIFTIMMISSFQDYMPKDTPLLNSFKEIDCYDTYIHYSSFSFLPFEFVGCGNNFLINNESYYNTPITQKNRLINSINEIQKPYSIVTEYNNNKIIGEIVFNQSNLLIQRISHLPK
jgi:hypothetical protein